MSRKNNPCSEGFNTHLWGFLGVRWKMFVFRVNLGMWPLKLICLGKLKSCSEGFTTHIYGIPRGVTWQNIHFQSKPRHVTPQIDNVRKTSHVLWVSTHIYGVSKKIDQKTCIFRVNLGMWPLKSIISEKQSLCCGFQHTFIGFPRR